MKTFVIEYETPPLRALFCCECDAATELDARKAFARELPNSKIRKVGVNSKFKPGDKVRKTKGSWWHGTVVGTYSTELTPEGYCVESHIEKGSVQIYPAAALEKWPI